MIYYVISNIAFILVLRLLIHYAPDPVSHRIKYAIKLIFGLN
jgi:hypothetical protein